MDQSFHTALSPDRAMWIMRSAEDRGGTGESLLYPGNGPATVRSEAPAP
jgi:hypothetical protein